MDVGALITWAFGNPDIIVAVSLLLMLVVLGISAMGIVKSVRNRRARRVWEQDSTAVAAGAAAQAAAIAAARADRDAPEPSLGATDIAQSFGHGQGTYQEPVFAAAPEPSPVSAGPAPGNPAADITASLAATVASNYHAATANQQAAAPEPAPITVAAAASETVADAALYDAAPDDVRAVVFGVFERNFPDLHATAYDEARAVFGVFADRCAVAAADRLLPDERGQFAHAELQLLLLSIMGEVAKRRDEAKYDILVSLLIGRIKSRDNADLVELLEETIEAVCRINVAHLRIVVMCLYLRSLQLRTNRIEELETVVKYATQFGDGADFSNLHTGPLFTRGLLLYNGAMDRVEGQILRAYARLFEVDEESLRSYRANAQAGRELVRQRLNLSEQQAVILDALGKSQCGRATATGVGWAAAAAYIELETGQPADWERAVA